MNSSNGMNPVLDGIWFRPFLVRPSTTVAPSTTGLTNAIPPTIKVVDVQAVNTNADDWLTLPDIADVPNGHEITILCNAGGNFELRTPASSNTKINNQDSDGTKEYLCTDTEIVKVVKLNSTTGWVAWSFTALGAKTTAVVPD